MGVIDLVARGVLVADGGGGWVLGGKEIDVRDIAGVLVLVSPGVTVGVLEDVGVIVVVGVLV